MRRNSASLLERMWRYNYEALTEYAGRALTRGLAARRAARRAAPFALLLLVMCSANAHPVSSGPMSGADAGVESAGTDAGDAGESGTAASGGPDGSTGIVASEGGASGGSVLQFHNHVSRDGAYVDGALTKSALSGTTLHLDSTFHGTGIQGEVRASPVYLANDSGGGTFYVATESNNVYAFDALSGDPATPTRNLGSGLSQEPCGQAHTVGIRGTPAIDPVTGVLVLSAATGSGGTLAKHTIYGLSLTDLSTRWSLDVSTLLDPIAGPFSPTDQNQRSAVLIVGGIAYVAYGGFYGDCGTYHGWVIGIPLANPTLAKAYATPAAESGIWAPGGASSDGTNIYVATGNGGLYKNAWGGAFSVLRLQAGPLFSGTVSNYWNAANDTGDVDLGGSGPIMVDAPAASLAVQLGKDGYAYLLDRTRSLGGSSSPLSSVKMMDDEITCAPATVALPAVTYLVMVGNNAGTGGHACPNGTRGQLVVATVDTTNAASPLVTAWCGDPLGGGSPIITTSDGVNDPLVWVVGASNRNDESAGSNQLHAWDMATGAPVVVGSDTLSGVHHFVEPIVVGGRIFVAGDTQLFALKP